MTHDGAKFNLAKPNLIGRIQFKHIKNCIMFMYKIGYFLIGLWVLFSWYVLEYQLFGGWLVSKKAATRLLWRPQTIKLIKWAQNLWSPFFKCHSLCTAPWFHDIISKETIPKHHDWCKISKCCDMIGAR